MCVRTSLWAGKAIQHWVLWIWFNISMLELTIAKVWKECLKESVRQFESKATIPCRWRPLNGLPVVARFGTIVIGFTASGCQFWKEAIHWETIVRGCLCDSRFPARYPRKSPLVRFCLWLRTITFAIFIFGLPKKSLSWWSPQILAVASAWPLLHYHDSVLGSLAKTQSNGSFFSRHSSFCSRRPQCLSSIPT